MKYSFQCLPGLCSALLCAFFSISCIDSKNPETAGSGGSDTGTGTAGGETGQGGQSTSSTTDSAGGGQTTTSTTTETKNPQGPVIFDLVSAGGLSKSSKYKVIMTFGQSTTNALESTSSNHTVHGGLIGASESTQ